MIFKLLWPEICPFCGKVHREGICSGCKEKIQKLVIEQPVCMKCGKPVWKAEQEYCYDCAGKIHYFDRGRALWLHKPPVNHSIYQFKYHNQRRFGKYYAEKIVEKYHRFLAECQPDLIIPIPLHIKKRRQRGFNQSYIIAKEIGQLISVPVDDTILKRVRYTKPQKRLDHKSRKDNLSGAFRVSKSLRRIKTILLVDDIYTTGNTLDEAARILKIAGVKNVYFITVSIGQGY